MSFGLYLLMLESNVLNRSCIKELGFVRRPQNVQVGRRPQIFYSSFDVILTISNNVIKQVLLKSCYITTFPGGWEESIIRLSSVQLQLNLPFRTELGNI